MFSGVGEGRETWIQILTTTLIRWAGGSLLSFRFQFQNDLKFLLCKILKMAKTNVH